MKNISAIDLLNENRQLTCNKNGWKMHEIIVCSTVFNLIRTIYSHCMYFDMYPTQINKYLDIKFLKIVQKLHSRKLFSIFFKKL